MFTPPSVAAARTAPPLPPGVYTNRPQYRDPGGSPTIIVLDAANTSLPTQSSARLYMLKWIVDKYRPGDRVAVFSLTNRLNLLTDFTDDPQLLLSVLRGYVAQKPAETAAPVPSDFPALTMGGLAGNQEALVTAASQFASYEGEREYVMNRRADITIAAMRTLMRFLGGMPGRKNVIWLTASFPFSLVPDDAMGPDSSGSRWTDLELARSGPGMGSGLSAGQQRLYSDRVRDIAAQFANAQVAIYPVDATGLTGNLSSNAVDRRLTMEEVASETGGRAFVNQNDLDRGVELAFADRAASYTLGYYPADKKWDGGYRKITIKIDRPGVELRHRPGYFALDPANENRKKSDRELNEAVQDRISASEITFDAKVSTLGASKTRFEFVVDGSTLSVEDVDKGKHIDVNFAVVVFDPKGKVVSNEMMKLDKVLPLKTYQELVQQGLTVHLDVDTPVGKDIAWLAVRDNHNGYVGSLQAPIGR